MIDYNFEVYNWITKVIESCKTEEQALNCLVLLDRYERMFCRDVFYYHLRYQLEEKTYLA